MSERREWWINRDHPDPWFRILADKDIRPVDTAGEYVRVREVLPGDASDSYIAWLQDRHAALVEAAQQVVESYHGYGSMVGEIKALDKALEAEVDDAR